MSEKHLMASVALASVLPFLMAGSAAALSVSCAGVSSASSITWTASSSGGVAPVAYLWGNGSTSSAQTVPATQGTYTMSLQATDASSTVATTTCAATVAAPAATSSDQSLGAQIKALLEQIMALKAQLIALLQAKAAGGSGTATSIPAGKSCFGISHNGKNLERKDAEWIAKHCGPGFSTTTPFAKKEVKKEVKKEKKETRREWRKHSDD